jgi:SAM-dependent methyltransferase
VSQSSLDAGAARFSGFAGLYHGVRPLPPGDLGRLLASYCGGRPGLVVDLGSGTGLSSRWAAAWADAVVGVEPSDDMRTTAEAAAPPNVRYRAGWSHDTGLPDGSADVVLAVQALHWMEPGPTFTEVTRLLRPGGVFAAIDCDWPPSIGDAVAEHAWHECHRQIRVYETRLARGAVGADLVRPIEPDELTEAEQSTSDGHQRRELPAGVRSWSKEQHLDRMLASGRFMWCREIAMTSTEPGNGRRFVDLLRSQGGYQTVARHGLDDATLGMTALVALVDERLGTDERPLDFVYRARLGFKES